MYEQVNRRKEQHIQKKNVCFLPSCGKMDLRKRNVCFTNGIKTLYSLPHTHIHTLNRFQFLVIALRTLIDIDLKKKYILYMYGRKMVHENKKQNQKEIFMC